MERKVILCLFFIAILFVWMPEKAESAVREVGEGKPYAQVTEALRVAESGDVIRVYPGEYRGNLVIDRSVTLEAVEIGKAKIIGTGEGNVITVRHPGVTIRGFEISSGGLNYLKNDAAIMVTRDGARIEKNRIRQSLFGIYLKKSSNHVIRENDIVGREERSFSERGNGLQIYYSHPQPGGEKPLSPCAGRDLCGVFPPQPASLQPGGGLPLRCPLYVVRRQCV